MGDDLTTETGPDKEAKKPSREILQQEMKEGLRALEAPAGSLFISALSAGLDIGFGPFLMAAVYTLAAGELPRPLVAILVANSYAVGFIFVVLGRSELFTEQTTLAVLPVLNRRSSVGALLRLWSLVFAGNMVGSVCFSILAVLAGPAIGVIEPAAFGAIAQPLMHDTWWVALMSAVLAGWLMGLLSWLVAAGRDTISQVVLVWLIATSIGLGHFNHIVAGSAEVFEP